MPDQARIVFWVHEGAGSSDLALPTKSDTQASAKTQTKRAAITTRQTRAAQPSSVQVERPERESRMPGSCSPTSANSRPFRSTKTISQTAWPCMRVCGVVSSGVYQPI